MLHCGIKMTERNPKRDPSKAPVLLATGMYGREAVKPARSEMCANFTRARRRGGMKAQSGHRVQWHSEGSPGAQLCGHRVCCTAASQHGISGPTQECTRMEPKLSAS